MRRLIWGIVVGVSCVASSMPSGCGTELSFGQPIVPDSFVTADKAWSEAGARMVEPAAGAARESCEEYPVDLCGCEPDSAGDPDWVAGHDEACSENPGPGCCGGLDADRPSRRFYITGIIGASFGTLQSGGTNTVGDFTNTGRANASLLTAGGAVGMAFDRANGLLRLEVEGRGRDALSGLTNSFNEPPTPRYFYSVRAADGWSVMANAWRDWYLTERLGFYGGGGIGAGGYRLNVDDGIVSGYGHVGGFAWQAGTGTTYRVTQRTTIDLGYRFFDTVSDSLPLTAIGSGGYPAGSYVSNFYASELLLSVRIYEPFRSRPVR